MAYYLFPGRGHGPVLELTALGADGRFATSVTIPRHWTQAGGLEPGAVVRVPLILAVRNIGDRPTPPTRLELSLPTRYRLSRSNGEPLPAEFLSGTPLIRYSIPVPATKGAAGSIAGYLPVLDTVWLEPIIPSVYCIALSDSVPDFVPSPPAPVEAIARVRIFYSFAGEELGQRQTGLLAVQLDPTLLKLEAPAPPPVFPTEYHDPVAPRPYLSELTYKGSRRAFCGDPQDPVEILSTLWETPAGGRLFVLDYGGAPRKYLFDLNRDSIVELELWDASGSGHFDARRQARLPIPAFLMPPTGPPPFDASVYATLPPEQLLALDRYGRASSGPYRFQTAPPEQKPRTQRFRPGAIGSDEAPGRGGVTLQYWENPAGVLAPGGSALQSEPSQMLVRPWGAPGMPAPVPAHRAPAGQTPPSAGWHGPPPTAGPPTLGRPITPPIAPPNRAPTAPPDRAAPAPGRGGEPADKPSEQHQEKPTTAPKPAPTPSAKPKPKVLGRPLDSIPSPARPDTTGA